MNRKIISFIALIISAAAILSGCSTTTTTPAVSSGSGLSTASKLALGTLKLEGTGNAVTASQASQLLTLWQGYQSLTNTDTTAAVELEALVSQIEGSLTSQQVQAIQAMNLSEQSLSEALSTLGGNTAASSASGTPQASTSGSASASAGGPGGGMPGGAPPSGGDSVSAMLGNTSGGTTSQSTPAATQSASVSSAAQVSPRLLQAVIQLLESRSQSSG